MKELEPLVGEWSLEAIPRGGEPWPSLWREGQPFPQRFTARFEDDGNTIAGCWEKAEDGGEYETDFDLI